MNILYVIHNLGPDVPMSKGKARRGGCESLTYQLAHSLSNRHTCYILYPDIVNKQHYYLHKVEGFSNSCEAQIPELTHFHKLDQFSKLLDTYKIDIIHYQHLIHNPVEYVLIGKLKGVKQVLTIHDYYFLCEEHFLENDMYVACEVPSEIGKCISCLKNKLGASASSVFKRRELMKSLLGNMDKIYFPSKSVRTDYFKVYPELNDKFNTMIVGTPNAFKYDMPLKVDKLRIGIKNYLTYIKGWIPLIEAIKMCEDRDINVEFHILCDHMDDGQRKYLEGLSNVVMDSDFDRVNLVWLPTIAKETYSLLADEVYKMGIPMMCSDRGAIAERFSDLTTILYPYALTPTEIVDRFESISKDPSILLAFQNNILKPESENTTTLHDTDYSAEYFHHQYSKLIK